MTSWKKLLLRVLGINTAIALVPPFLLVALGERVSFQRLVDAFGFSFFYAQCIGSLAFAIMPRLWIRSERAAPWIRWPLRAVTLLAASVAGGMIACLIFVALGWIPLRLYWAEFRASFKIALFLTVAAGTVISMYESFRARLEDTALQLRTKELERERALKLATAAQLASLESRIHPHFLFNTLNSISSLIPEDPGRAEQLIEQMASLLRFSLDAHHAGLVPLDREMKIVSDYLAIEQARFGERLRFHIDSPGEIGEAKVPPLAIQTLVENSVKHAISRSRLGGEIRVSIARENGSLRVQVQDEGPEFSLQAAPAGHGLDNLTSRLAALFGERGSLCVTRAGSWNRTILSVPQDKTDASIPG
ncbi:MAG TPA: histidine kinase [Bryobacteraceae bacterium]|nr:histidine kinase [Bryobacteraceae bacterium]